MFDDRLVIETPGKLPGLVKINNIRKTHFSRNPNIMKILKEYSFVREHGEGVDRMFDGMELAGLEAPEYEQNSFMTILTLKNGKHKSNLINEEETKYVRLTKEQIEKLQILLKRE